EKQKLTGPNFIDWYRQLKIVLSIEDKLNYLEQPIPPVPVAPAEQELLQTTRDFHSCRQEEGQSVSSYVLKMKGYIDNLERLGHPVTLGLGTVNELHVMLKLHEQTLPKSNASALNAIRADPRHKMRPNMFIDISIRVTNASSLINLRVAFHAINDRRLPLAPLVYTLVRPSVRSARGFFEKQKLTGPNFIDWYRQLRIVLSIEDKLNYLEHHIPPVSVAHAEIQRNLEPLHAYEMLMELKTLFAQQAEQELLQTTRDFHSCRQEEGQSVSLYVLKMKGYIDNLERLGYPVTLGLGVSLILIGLRKEYDGFVQNYNMHSTGKTINELHAMLKLHEQTLPKRNAPALNAIRAGKVQKGNKHKKSHSQKGAKGQNQGKGKFVPKPKIPLHLKGKIPQSTLSIMSMER
nr:zinc finger, CCHC-type [Tanacetum cinerariifolium]